MATEVGKRCIIMKTNSQKKYIIALRLLFQKIKRLNGDLMFYLNIELKNIRRLHLKFWQMLTYGKSIELYNEYE